MKRTTALLATACLLATTAGSVSAAASSAASISALPEERMDHISVRSLGSGSAVLLIPGLASPRDVYAGIAADLARNHRVLLVQVNGFGGDAPGRNAQGGVLAGVTRDIVRYLERENIRTAVIGHSMGGVIGMRLARDHADRIDRLMIVDSLPFIGLLFGPGITTETVKPIADDMRRSMLASAERPPQASGEDPTMSTMSITPEGRRQVSAWALAANRQVAAQAMYETTQQDLRGDLLRIARVPTTVLHAVPPLIAQQARALWSATYAAAPEIRLVAVENSHHFIMLDQPDVFAREVASFLAPAQTTIPSSR